MYGELAIKGDTAPSESRHSSVSSKMRSIAFIAVIVCLCTIVDAGARVGRKPGRTIRKKLKGNVEDKFKIFRNEETEEEINKDVDEHPTDKYLPQPMTTPASSSSFAENFGYNIAERVTMDWGAMEQYMLTMQMNEYTRGLVQDMVDANPCVDSLAAYNSMMEGGAKLLIDNGPLIENMLTSLLSMR